MVSFVTIVTGPKLVNVAAKRSILNLCGSLGYASGIIIHNSKVNTKTNSKMKKYFNEIASAKLTIKH